MIRVGWAVEGEDVDDTREYMHSALVRHQRRSGEGRAWRPPEIVHLSIRNHFRQDPNAGVTAKVKTLAGGVPEAGIRFADRPVTDTGIRIIVE